MSPQKKLAIDSAKIPKKFVATEAIEFLNNDEFIKKVGSVVSTEITTITVTAKDQAKQKINKAKASAAKDKIKARLAAE